MSYALSFIVSLLVTVVLIPPLMRSAARWKFVDYPDARKVHAVPIPRIGGVAMVLGSILAISMWWQHDPRFMTIVAAASVISIFGLWDDRVVLNHKIKFVGQILAALIVVYWGEVRIESVPFVAPGTLPDFVLVPLTIFAILGMTNAVNMSDGLDGLAGGSTLLSLGGVAALSYLMNDASVLLVAIAVMGSILGFLRFNSYPARIFMGDGGSQFLGFIAGTLAIVLVQDSHGVLSPALPLLFLGLPILDTFLVMATRARQGLSLFSPDKNHIHHRLLALKLTHYQAVFVIYVLQLILVTCAYYFREASDVLIVSVYTVFCIVLLAMLNLTRLTGWQVTAPVVGEKIRALSPKGWLVIKWFSISTTISILAYLAAAVLYAQPLSQEVVFLSVLLFLTLALSMITNRHKPFTLLERGCIYMTGALAIFILETSKKWLGDHYTLHNLYFYMLSIGVVLGIIFSRHANFRVTPLDFLVVVAAITLPNVTTFEYQHVHVGELAVKTIAFLYAIELILANVSRRWDAIRLLMLATLAAMMVRSVFA